MAAKKAPMRKMAAPKPATRKAPVKKTVATKKSTASSKNLTPAQQKALAARNKVRGGQGATSKTRTLTRAQSVAMGTGANKRNRKDQFGQRGLGETGELGYSPGGIQDKIDRRQVAQLQKAWREEQKKRGARGVMGGKKLGPVNIGMSGSLDAESVIPTKNLKYVDKKTRRKLESMPIDFRRFTTQGYVNDETGTRYLSRNQSKIAATARNKAMQKRAPKTQKYRSK